MKEQTRKEYIRRVRNILMFEHNGANIIGAINSRAVSKIKYGVGIIGWLKAELEEAHRKTKKLLTMYGAHYLKADVNMLYLRRTEGGKDLIGVEDCG